MNIKTLVLYLFFLIGYLNEGFAMRCHQSLVLEGDSEYSVLKKCGNPLSKQIINNNLYLNNPYYTPTPNYEIWTYQNSPNDFLYQVLFEDGFVKTISANRSDF